MASKRSYTVPVLLVIIVVLSTLTIMVYSKLLIIQQKQTTDEGRRLAEQYIIATIFAERLSGAADLLMKDTAMAEKLRGKQLLGEASFAAAETVGILTDAVHRSGGGSREEAFKPISVAMAAVNGKLSGFAEHDGPLTPTERGVLIQVHTGAAKMVDTLHRFRAPGGEAGFRQMVAGGEWISAARDAVKALEDMASMLDAVK